MTRCNVCNPNSLTEKDKLILDEFKSFLREYKITTSDENRKLLVQSYNEHIKNKFGYWNPLPICTVCQINFALPPSQICTSCNIQIYS